MMLCAIENCWSNLARIEAEQEMVNATKKLIDIYEQRIKDKIGEELDATMAPFKQHKDGE